MGRRPLTAAQEAYLLDGTASACAYGTVDWREVNGAWSGDVPVAATSLEDHDLLLRYQHRPTRPTEPSILLLVDGECLARVDINGGHAGRVYSHWHYPRFNGTGSNVDAVPDWMACPTLEPPLDELLMPQLLRDAGRLFNVDTAAVDWEYPPRTGGAS